MQLHEHGRPRVPAFLRRTGLALIGQGGQAAASFLLTIAVARAVDPSIRGTFVLLTLVPQLGAYIATLGLPGAVMRSAAREPDARPALLGVSVVGALGGGALLTAATPLLMSLSHAHGPPIALVAVGTIALTWLIFAAWFAFGCEQFLVAGALRTFPVLGAALAVLALDALGHHSLVVLFAPWAGLHGAIGLVALAYLVRRYGIVRPQRAQVAAWTSYGIRYSAIQILNLVTLRLDQLILGGLASTAAVGLYSIGVSLSEGLLLVTTAVGLVVFLDSARGETAAGFRRKLLLTVLASSAAAGLLVLVAQPLVHALFGERYEPAVALTRILAIGTPGLVVMRLMTNRLAGGGQPGRASIYALVALGLTSALDFALIPSHGATGAAWASSIGYDVGGAVALLTARSSWRPRDARAPVQPVAVSAAAPEPRGG
ncbi:MAG TPA: oligosaccharide flippase family protein [Conexibacter sp.]|nr:oligosaccharide flippase family protein [Conexibacter sp.]